MDSYEATKMVFSRIKGLEPENASKIMGYLLLQDHGDKEMIRLAFGPDTLLHNLILQAKTHLGFSSNTPSSPSPFNPTSSRSNTNLSLPSSRITANGFDVANPSSPSSSSWSLLSPNSTSSLSYSSIVNGTSNNSSSTVSSSLSSTGSLSNAFSYNTGHNTNGNTCYDPIHENQLQNQSTFLNDAKIDDLFNPRLDLAMSPTAYGDTQSHRRSLSVPGFGSADANFEFGWNRCLYFARGFCMNGASCKFSHVEELGDGAHLVGSPSKLGEFEQCQEFLRPASGLANNSNAITSVSQTSSPFLSYENIRSGSTLKPSSAIENGGSGSGDVSRGSNELPNEYQLDEYFSFLDDFPSKREEFGGPRVQLSGFGMNNEDAHLHRRRFSDSDACFSNEDGGFGIGYRPCLYFARGFCKNGGHCKFVHGDGDSIGEVNVGGIPVGSPREMEGLYLQQQENMMRMKAAQQQQRLAYNKYMNFLLQQESDSKRMGIAPAMVGNEFHKFGQSCPERNDFLAMAMEERANSASRQIYLTFPADSTFKDEDVSNYFSTFGPVQDVRIPYQQKRMFGFVTFVHADTVKHILSRGNPHFICDSRVLVKPYKEKGKVTNNRRQQHVQQQLIDRGSFSPCYSPSGLDPRELYELHLGSRVFSNTQEMMLRKKLEQQAELQQAIELQGRRLINLQLPDLREDYIHHHKGSLSADVPITAHALVDLNPSRASDVKNQDVLEDKGDSSATSTASTVAVQNPHHEGNSIRSNDTASGNVESSNPEGCDTNERCEGIVEHGQSSTCLAEVKESSDISSTKSLETNVSLSTTSSVDVASPK